MKKYLLLLLALTTLSAGFTSCDDDDDDNKFKPVNVETRADMQTALDDGYTDVTLTTPLTEDATFNITRNYAAGTELKITVPANGNDVTITSANAGSNNAPQNVELKITDADNLTINLPASTVVFTGDVEGILTSSTAANTLDITATSVVNELVVLRGNVRVFGGLALEDVTVTGADSKVIWAVKDAAELRAKLLIPVTPSQSGVVLTADISSFAANQGDNAVFHIGNATGDDYDGFILDGNGNTISGSTSGYNVITVLSDEVVIRDLTVTQSDAYIEAKRNNGMSVYRVSDVELINVTLQDNGNAGLIVSSSSVRATNLNTSGNGWGGVNVTEGTSPAGGGAPTFTLVSGTIGETVTATATPAKIWIDLKDGAGNTIGYTVNVPTTQTWYYGDLTSADQVWISTSRSELETVGVTNIATVSNGTVTNL